MWSHQVGLPHDKGALTGIIACPICNDLGNPKTPVTLWKLTNNFHPVAPEEYGSCVHEWTKAVTCNTCSFSERQFTIATNTDTHSYTLLTFAFHSIFSFCFRRAMKHLSKDWNIQGSCSLLCRAVVSDFSPPQKQRGSVAFNLTSPYASGRSYFRLVSFCHDKLAI